MVYHPAATSQSGKARNLSLVAMCGRPAVALTAGIEGTRTLAQTLALARSLR